VILYRRKSCMYRHRLSSYTKLILLLTDPGWATPWVGCKGRTRGGPQGPGGRRRGNVARMTTRPGGWVVRDVYNLTKGHVMRDCFASHERSRGRRAGSQSRARLRAAGTDFASSRAAFTFAALWRGICRTVADHRHPGNCRLTDLQPLGGHMIPPVGPGHIRSDSRLGRRRRFAVFPSRRSRPHGT